MSKEDKKYSFITIIILLLISLVYVFFFYKDPLKKDAKDNIFKKENDVLEYVLKKYGLTEKNIGVKFKHNGEDCYIFLYEREGSIGTRFLRIKQEKNSKETFFKPIISSSFILPKFKEDNKIYGVTFCSDEKLSINVWVEEGDTRVGNLPYKETKEVVKNSVVFNDIGFKGIEVKYSAYEVEYFEKE